VKVAVTGASGHLGANLVRRLITTGYQVKVLVYRDDRALSGLDVEITRGNILDQTTVEKLVQGCDVVFHCAAAISIGSDSREVERINYQGTVNVLNACKKHKTGKLIHFSSIHVFDPHPLSEKLDETRNYSKDAFAYDRSKVAAEKAVLAFDGGFDKVVLNPTAMIGPNDFKPSLVGRTIIKFCHNAFPVLLPGGYDWVDVRAVANAAVYAIDKGKNGERYLLSGEFRTVKGLATLIGDIYGSKVPAILVSRWLAAMGLPFVKMANRGSKQPRLFTRMSLYTLKNSNPNIDSSKAKTELGFDPPPLKTTLSDTIQWFQQNGRL